MFNEEKWIKQCVQSLQEQSYDKNAFEILVIDDESNDQCTNYVSEIIDANQGVTPSLNLFRIEHGGLAIARNEGIKRAKGEYILFIDGDAIADKDWLANYIKVFESTDCDFSSGKINLLNTESKFANLLHETRFKQSIDNVAGANYLHGVNMAFKRSVMDQYKGFYENFTSRGDDTSFSFLIRQDKEWAPSKDSVVLHERPESFMEWWKVYTKELSISIMTSKVIATQSKSMAITHMVTFAKSGLFNLMILGSFFVENLWALTVISPIILKNGAYFNSYGSIAKYGLSTFIATADLTLRVYYISAAFVKNIGTELKAPFTTTSNVLISKSNL
ncbi:MAG: glycosyltransferase [Flavobacteriales bacterium]|nr:glycosyltransferase [Flavobacteriales bacterium]